MRRARFTDDGDLHGGQSCTIFHYEATTILRNLLTSCSIVPMSSSISDCRSVSWNASPFGPRARAIGATEPSSFHRAIGLRINPG